MKENYILIERVYEEPQYLKDMMNEATDIRNTIIKDTMDYLKSQRKEQIKHALFKSGFDVSPNGLDEFLKERCEILSDPENPNKKILLVDGKDCVLTWSEEITTSLDGNIFKVSMG